MKKLNIQCYGLFSDFQKHIEIFIEGSISISELIETINKSLVEKLGPKYTASSILEKECVFGIDGEIKDNSFMVSEGMKVSILPPVCGG